MEHLKAASECPKLLLIKDSMKFIEIVIHNTFFEQESILYVTRIAVTCGNPHSPEGIAERLRRPH